MADKQPVAIDSRWIRVVRSPVGYAVTILTGISVSGSPLFLYWAGQGKFDSLPLWFSFLQYGIIALGYGTMIFHLSLSSATMNAIRVEHPASARHPANRSE
ncbi:MAG: hypothetical protein WD648_00115 [Planctomycetaceae bacterium]